MVKRWKLIMGNYASVLENFHHVSPSAPGRFSMHMVRDSVCGKIVVMLRIHTFSRGARGYAVRAKIRCKTVVML